MTISGNFGNNNVLPYSSPQFLRRGFQGGQLQTVQTYGMRAYWPMGNSSFWWWGSVANSRYLDTSSGDNEIPQSGSSVLPSVAGFWDSGVFIDGSASSLQDQNSDASPSGGGDRSFCCWAMVPDFTTIRRIFAYGQVATNQLWQAYIEPNPAIHAGQTAQTIGLSLTNNVAFGNIAITANVPWHMAVCYTTGLSSTKFYVNGVLNTTNITASDTANTFANQKFFFGQLPGGTAGSTATTWDSRFYSRLLSQADVMDIVQAGFAAQTGSQYSMWTEMPVLKAAAVGKSFATIIG